MHAVKPCPVFSVSLGLGGGWVGGWVGGLLTTMV